MKNWSIRLGSFILALLISTIGIYAQDSNSDLGVTFEGDSAEFIAYETTNAFDGIMPGEERVQKIVFTNNDYRELKFYVRADYNKPLGEGKTKEQIAYDINFSSNGEAFVTSRIGGITKANMNDLSTNYLISTLKKGESTTLDLSIKVDGDSMDNTYQGTEGNMNLIFSVEHDDKTPMDSVTTIIQKIPVINKLPGVSTGDVTSVGLILGFMAACFVIIVVWILITLKNRKGKNYEEKSIS